MNPEIKIFTPSAFKFLETDGQFEAVFATLNIVDAHGDVTIPGAFGEQDVVISQYNHGSWNDGVAALPIGVGKIFERGEEAIVHGEFNLGTQAGAETYKAIRWLHEKGRKQQWSYALPEVESETSDFQGQRVRLLKKIRVPEVSPVLEGAGINTRLLAIKSKDESMTLADHIESVVHDVTELHARLAKVAELRETEGKQISEAKMGRVASLRAQLIKTAAELARLESPKVHDELVRERLRFEKIRSDLSRGGTQCLLN